MIINIAIIKILFTNFGKKKKGRKERDDTKHIPL